jgi:hypothetical protein
MKLVCIDLQPYGTRAMQVDGRSRSYLVHVPPKCDPETWQAVLEAVEGAANR